MLVFIGVLEEISDYFLIFNNYFLLIYSVNIYILLLLIECLIFFENML